MPRSQDLQNPALQILICLSWFTLLAIFTPPFIAIKLSIVHQNSIELSIKDFNISTNGFNSNSNSNQTTIYFNLYIGNSEDTMQVHYGNLNLTFSYNASTGIVPVGNYTIPAFLQGLEKHTERKDNVVMSSGIKWQDIFKNASATSSGVVFRVDLSAAVKFKEYVWKIKSKRRKIMAWANVEVDPNTGKKISKKDVKLKHMINHYPSGGVIAGAVILIFFFCCIFCSPCVFALVYSCS